MVVSDWFKLTKEGRKLLTKKKKSEREREREQEGTLLTQEGQNKSSTEIVN